MLRFKQNDTLSLATIVLSASPPWSPTLRGLLPEPVPTCHVHPRPVLVPAPGLARPRSCPRSCTRSCPRSCPRPCPALEPVCMCLPVRLVASARLDSNEQSRADAANRGSGHTQAFHCPSLHTRLSLHLSAAPFARPPVCTVLDRRTHPLSTVNSHSSTRRTLKLLPIRSCLHGRSAVCPRSPG